MPIVIPTEPGFAYTFTAVLESSPWRFSVKWNATDQAYYLDIEGIEVQRTVRNIKLIVGLNLLDPYAISELGALAVTDREPEGGFQDPTFESLGDRHGLIYFPRSEL